MKRRAISAPSTPSITKQEKTYGPEDSQRLTFHVNVVTVVGVIRGTVHPNRYVVMSGDIDPFIEAFLKAQAAGADAS